MNTDERIAREAAEWVLRLQQGLDAAEEKIFSAWLSEAGHREVFTEMSETSALLNRLHRPAARSRRFGWAIAASLAAAAALALGYFGWWAPQKASFAEVAQTGVGGSHRLALPDGSVVHLNTASAVDVAYSGTERRVRLSAGEAYFTVAKNSSRPFYVEAGPVVVRAVGTAFNVRLNPASVVVVVTEGQVKLADAVAPSVSSVVASSELFLGAGERAVVTRDRSAVVSVPAPDRIEPDEIARSIAWTEHQLQFSGTPLREIVAEFNRYNAHQLQIGDPMLAELKFGGSFAPTGYLSFLEVLEQEFGIVGEARGAVTVLRRKP